MTSAGPCCPARPGYLVPPRAPEALADALQELLTDPARRRRMGAAGRDRVRAHFSAEATVRAIDTLYGELLRRREPRPDESRPARA